MPDIRLTDDERWTRFRRQMPVAERFAYFDHAAVAPISGPAREAMVRWADESATGGDTRWPEWAARLRQIRRAAATLVGAAASEIALVRNTTEGISLIAEGFPWEPGDNVVVPAGEFPSNLYPWLNLQSRGVDVRRIDRADGRLLAEDVARACDERTRIVALSWVGYATGWRCDLAAMAAAAHDAGALLFVDAIQGLGVFPLDVRDAGIDFFAADGHKWLLGPEGAGLLYVRREHLDRLRPLGVGWNSVVHDHDFDRIALDWKPSAERYEGGSPNMPGLLALGASLDLLSALDIPEIGRRILEIVDVTARRLEAIGATVTLPESAACRSGIVCFDLPGQDPQAIRRRCRQHGVVLSCRSGRLRISPHAYASNEDIDQLIAALTDAGP